MTLSIRRLEWYPSLLSHSQLLPTSVAWGGPPYLWSPTSKGTWNWPGLFITSLMTREAEWTPSLLCHKRLSVGSRLICRSGCIGMEHGTVPLVDEVRLTSASKGRENPLYQEIYASSSSPLLLSPKLGIDHVTGSVTSCSLKHGMSQCIRSASQSNELSRGSTTELVDRGTSQRRKSIAWQKFYMGWLYRSPIPVGRRGVFYSFK